MYKIDKKDIKNLKVRANAAWVKEYAFEYLRLGFAVLTIGDIHVSDMGAVQAGKAALVCDSLKEGVNQSISLMKTLVSKKNSKPASAEDLDF